VVISKFASRKFIVVMSTLVGAYFALWQKLLESGDFTLIASLCIGAYTAANVATEYVAKKNNNANPDT
jgi:hypothetical protein